jgi:hypothetical protein
MLQLKWFLVLWLSMWALFVVLTAAIHYGEGGDRRYFYLGTNCDGDVQYLEIVQVEVAN